MKLGAGVQGWEAYQAAEARGFRVLGGTCLTIGLVGGFTQAGGHSDLSSTYGLAADNVLEWEVVTANGTHLFASRTSHNDIYWALSGGGPGTYGVVLSMTVKVFPDGPVGGVSLAFTSANVSQDKYWRAVSAFHTSLLSWVEKGGSAAYTISNQSFYLQPATFPDLPNSEVHKIVQPLISNLTAENIAYSLNFTSSPTYLAHASHYYGPLPYGTYPSAQVQGGRLIPRSVVQDRNEEFRDVLQNITSGGAFQIIGTALDVSQSVVGSGGADTAVLPAWRDALITLIAASAWDYTAPLPQNTAHEQQITGIIDPSLQRVTGPDSGVYMNEGDFQQPGFRKQFYGPNYSKLRQIKKEYDPQDLFYVTAGVGSEAWRVAEDGRLCRAA
ncbi:MAG: hypothetical protein LQ338_003968 [Usnochroma carphineum]|nr:MAG: hypothetical protein LQ338_003968 [Usnochroma carphineum]